MPELPRPRLQASTVLLLIAVLLHPLVHWSGWPLPGSARLELVLLSLSEHLVYLLAVSYFVALNAVRLAWQRQDSGLQGGMEMGLAIVLTLLLP